MTCQLMTSLGVYMLGAAEPTERLRIEAHLPACTDCQAELLRLAPLPGLLARVPASMLAADQPAGQAPGPAVSMSAPGPARSRGTSLPLPGQALSQPAGLPMPAGAARSAGRRWRAAAASLAAAAAIAVGFWLAPQAASPRPATRQPAARTLAGANPALHVSATAVLTATSWGTAIELRLRGMPRNVPCRLIVHSRAGQTEISGVWETWRDGPISVPASAAWRLSDIASLQVASARQNLVTISAPRARAR